MKAGTVALGAVVTAGAVGLGVWLYKDLKAGGSDVGAVQMAGIDYNSNVNDAYVARRASQMKEFEVRKRLGL